MPLNPQIPLAINPAPSVNPAQLLELVQLPGQMRQQREAQQAATALQQQKLAQAQQAQEQDAKEQQAWTTVVQGATDPTTGGINWNKVWTDLAPQVRPETFTSLQTKAADAQKKLLDKDKTELEIAALQTKQDHEILAHALTSPEAFAAYRPLLKGPMDRAIPKEWPSTGIAPEQAKALLDGVLTEQEKTARAASATAAFKAGTGTLQQLAEWGAAPQNSSTAEQYAAFLGRARTLANTPGSNLSDAMLEMLPPTWTKDTPALLQRMAIGETKTADLAAEAAKLPIAQQNAEANLLSSQASMKNAQRLDQGGGSGGGDQRPLSEASEANIINRLTTQWQAATKPARDLERQAALMQTGLQAAKAGNTAAGAQAVLVTFQKILDPTSVVRESEYARSGAGLALLDRIEGAYERLVKGGAGVPVEELAKFADLAKQMVSASISSYLPAIKERIGKTADHYRIPRELVFEDVDVTTPKGGRPTLTQQGGKFVVTDPFGTPHEFPTEAAARTFLKAIGGS